MEVIGIVVLVAVVLIILMSGRSVRYYCRKCGNSWKGTKHHKNIAPRCPECGSHDIGRK